MPNKNFDLADAIAGCLKNDNKSKEIIYKSFYGFVMGVILRYVNDSDDSEELVNDSFMKIFRKIAQFKSTSDNKDLKRAFTGWVSKISSRIAIDFLRQKRINLYFDDLSEGERPQTKVSAISNLNVQDILKLLHLLPETHRIIFNMYELEGFSYEEISTILNIPENSCRVYLSRAKNKLRNMYS